MILNRRRHLLGKFVPAILPTVIVTLTLMLLICCPGADCRYLIALADQRGDFSCKPFNTVLVVLILCLDFLQRDFETFKLGPLLFAGFLGVLDRLLQRSHFSACRIERSLPITDFLLGSHLIRTQTLNLVFEASLLNQMGLNICLGPRC